MAIARAVSPRTCLVSTVAVALVIGLARPVASHTYAASAFDAVTEGKDVYVLFRLDGTSTIDMLKRPPSDGGAIGKDDIKARGREIFDYVAGRFTLRNGRADCPARVAEPPHLDDQTNKVTIAVIYGCAHELDELTLRSTLFVEEATPHQIIGTFRHGRALENYLLSRGLSEAVIHVNALAQIGPSEAVRPGQFQIEPPPPGAYEAAGRAALAARAQAARAEPVGSGFLAFFVQGIFHILGGLDHVLFVVALISVVASWRQLAMVVTSFTAAHSITLALGALDLVRLSPRVVEPLIAVTILYVALENVLRGEPRSRLGITFGFGLVHGFGFSSVLRDLGLSRAHLLPVLLGFNLGVETGQLLIVAPLAPFVWWLRRRTGAYPRFRLGVNACVALAAAFWFIQRLFVRQ
ncbi:MAG TPA: HupE/UreJ family protein [Polyangia bacterium]|jgi:hypothetical protein|nr:HupE/UreJ family protein [Polyangia bacterium]